MSLDCPRCGSSVDQDLYGPCDTCRHQLRAAFSGESRGDVVAEAYKPKMNVTPNAVATKD